VGEQVAEILGGREAEDPEFRGAAYWARVSREWAEAHVRNSREWTDRAVALEVERDRLRRDVLHAHDLLIAGALESAGHVLGAALAGSVSDKDQPVTYVNEQTGDVLDIRPRSVSDNPKENTST
jgi:hypothetical protein